MRSAAREDIRQLLKEYARAGYEAAQCRDEDFEVLWGQAFDCDDAEEKPRD